MRMDVEALWFEKGDRVVDEEHIAAERGLTHEKISDVVNVVIDHDETWPSSEKKYSHLTLHKETGEVVKGIGRTDSITGELGRVVIMEEVRHGVGVTTYTYENVVGAWWQRSKNTFGTVKSYLTVARKSEETGNLIIRSFSPDYVNINFPLSGPSYTWGKNPVRDIENISVGVASSMTLRVKDFEDSPPRTVDNVSHVRGTTFGVEDRHFVLHKKDGTIERVWDILESVGPSHSLVIPSEEEKGTSEVRVLFNCGGAQATVEDEDTADDIVYGVQINPKKFYKRSSTVTRRNSASNSRVVSPDGTIKKVV